MAVSTPTPVSGRGAPPAPTRPAPSGRGQAWRSRLYRLDVKGSPYAYVAPFFILFFAFGLFPLVYTAYVSLHNVDLGSPDQQTWVGMANYTRLLHRSEEHTSELQSRRDLVCRLLLEKKKKQTP